MTQSEKNDMAGKSNLKDWTRLTIFAEGNFFRVFNQDAFVLKKFLYSDEYAKNQEAQETKDKSKSKSKGLNITKSKTNDAGEYLFAGFPIANAPKFLRGMTPKLIQENNIFELEIPDDLIPKDLRFHEILEAEYEKYFKSVPYKEPKEKSNVVSSRTAPKKIDVFDILREIQSYDITSKNPIETVTFVSNLKMMTNNILFK